MPVIVKKKLILVEAKKISFKDKETGEDLTKYKYQFLTPDQKLLTGYLDTPDFMSDVQEVEGYSEEKAKEYKFKLSEYNGNTNEVLMPKSIEPKE